MVKNKCEWETDIKVRLCSKLDRFPLVLAMISKNKIETRTVEFQLTNRTGLGFCDISRT